MRWNVQHNLEGIPPKDRIKKVQDLLFINRGFTDEDSRQTFLNPPKPTLETILPLLPDLDVKQLETATQRIHKAITAKQPIIVYGDYDCDGVCSTAILWLTLHQLGATAMPFIPHRSKHGYGISDVGLEDALKLFPDKKPLIITVDNGISANKAADHIKVRNLDMIITDHHTPPDNLPPAVAIVHSTHLSGSGVAWILAANLAKKTPPLELVALGTVCDLLPLTSANRMLVKHGLVSLRATTNPGLQALYRTSNVDPTQIETYHLGYVLGPRINAVGRLGHALDALRLLCTKSPHNAAALAQKLSSINTDRQEITHDHAQQAIDLIKGQPQLPNLLFLASPEYHEGIIGLIASRITDYFHRPSIVVSIQGDIAKGSARSVKGVNITSIIAQAKSYLHSHGGHEQAAGFSTSPDQLELLQGALHEITNDIDPTLLEKTLDIEIDIDAKDLTFDLLRAVDDFAPFGVDNPRPVFSTTIPIKETYLIGKTKDHLKINPGPPHTNLDIIGFYQANKQSDLQSLPSALAAFTLQKNIYQGNTTLQLVLKDINPNKSAWV